ncbi:uncharacterized protein LOC114861725 isoform X2 [Betta splendens]|uniref:Uncharacterized protein LOC114861725 isoform X2 n=1 Tax=Betta splendens TaxID=158456 RepID=A0A6P7NBY5_BETSP|nr:uncharacterized protein LOC114861725 isoform X2 [Betta splendens]
MNWVGGSRNRLVMKNDSKRQREFFEKRRMQQKLKNVGLALPAASPRANSGNMDLLTLFVVNQIAAKKEIREPPKVGVVGGSKRGSKHSSHDSLVLPMSPCSPSQLSLAESQPQYSSQVIRQRRNAIPQGFKFRQLSPVLESAFSDNSASDYLPHTADPLSSLSSASSASSGQGIFPLQISLQQRSLNKAQPVPHCCSPPWDPSGLDQTEFQPFSLSRGVTCNKPWAVTSNQPLYQQETAAQVLFGNPEPVETEVRDHSSQEGRLSLNGPVDKDPMLEMLEREQQFKEDVFRGFCTEEYKREALYAGRPKSRIYLRRGTPNRSSTPQTVPDSESGMKLSSSIYTNLSGSGHKTGPGNSCEHLPSCSCREGYLSANSNDEEECCQLCFNTPASSCVNQAGCETPRVKEGSQSKPKERHAQRSPFTPLIAKGNFEEEQKVMDNEVHLHTACGSNRSSMAQCLSPRPLTGTQKCELCKCETVLRATREAGTQTALTAETLDASTQCDRVVTEAEYKLLFPPVDLSVPFPATGRQTHTAAEAYKQQNVFRKLGWREGYEQQQQIQGLHPVRKQNRKEFINNDSREIPHSSINPSLT